jgi:RNA polymerase sigma-70 factor, ECF subfamily
MLAFKSGDARAFEMLVRRHRTAVFNFVLRYTGARARAEDVLQDTWLKVIRRSAEYEAKARFTTWLYTIARNLCVDGARKEKHREVDSLDAPGFADGPALGETLPAASGSPEREAISHQLQPLLVRALQALPEEQREVFILREYSGLGFAEIAEVTATSQNTVKSRMRYALIALRKSLAAAGITDADVDERAAG